MSVFPGKNHLGYCLEKEKYYLMMCFEFLIKQSRVVGNPSFKMIPRSNKSNFHVKNIADFGLRTGELIQP
jgi:hypothetical protein